MNKLKPSRVAIIGGGPAGLMAAEVISQAGYTVDVYDAMPSLGRKFLLAGIGGLNITHSEDYAKFCARYADRQSHLQFILNQFTPDMLRAWVHGLGVETFVGTSGRVFPKEMKAAPLLRAWLHRLRASGVRLHVRSRWTGWNAEGALTLSTPQGEIALSPDATVLALGGASWPRLGSDGSWVPRLQDKGVQVASLESANCGFDVAWGKELLENHSGAPLKSVALKFVDVSGRRLHRVGEMVIGQHGVEGSLIYAFSREIRQVLHANKDTTGSATLMLDLLPDRSLEWVRVEVAGKARSTHSWSSYLKNKLGIKGVKMALLREVLSADQMADANTLAVNIKSLPITVTATRPLDEAISTAGGVCFESLNDDLMISNLPGTFVAGEMLDWEAPTGGYLLTACFATGLAAGRGVLRWIQ